MQMKVKNLFKERKKKCVCTIASRTNDVTKFNPRCDSDKQTIPFESDVWNNGARELMHGD